MFRFGVVILLLFPFLSPMAYGGESTRVDTALNQLSVKLTPNEATSVPEGSALKLRFKAGGALWHATVVRIDGKEAVFQMKRKVKVLRKGLGFRMFDLEGNPLMVAEETVEEPAPAAEMPAEVKGKVVRVIKAKNRVVMTFPEVQMVYFKGKDIREKFVVTEEESRETVEVSIFVKRSDRVVFDVAIADIGKFKAGLQFLFPVEGIEIEELFSIVPDEFINISGPMSYLSYPGGHANLRYVAGTHTSTTTFDEGDPNETKTALSSLYVDANYLFGSLGGVGFSYLSNSPTVEVEGADEAVKLTETVFSLDMAFQIAGFAGGIGFERYSFSNDIVDGNLAMNFNRALIYLGYVTGGLNLSLRYTPKTTATFTYKIDGDRTNNESAISSEVLVGFHWDPKPAMRIPVELGWFTDDGADDGVELKATEKLSVLAGMNFGINSKNTLSVAYIRNRSAMVPEYSQKFLAGTGSSARTGLALGYIFSADLIRAGAGVEYYAGGTQRTTESVNEDDEPIDVDLITEQTGIAGGFFIGINY